MRQDGVVKSIAAEEFLEFQSLPIDKPHNVGGIPSAKIPIVIERMLMQINSGDYRDDGQ